MCWHQTTLPTLAICKSGFEIWLDAAACFFIIVFDEQLTSGIKIHRDTSRAEIEQRGRDWVTLAVPFKASRIIIRHDVGAAVLCVVPESG